MIRNQTLFRIGEVEIFGFKVQHFFFGCLAKIKPGNWSKLCSKHVVVQELQYASCCTIFGPTVREIQALWLKRVRDCYLPPLLEGKLVDQFFKKGSKREYRVVSYWN